MIERLKNFVADGIGAWQRDVASCRCSFNVSTAAMYNFAQTL